MGIGGVILGIQVLLAVLLVLGPGPQDDVLFRGGLEEVAKSLPVSVPEFRAGDYPAQRASNDAGHHDAAGDVEPDDRVSFGEHDVLGERAVVAVYYPAVGLCPFADDLSHLVTIDRNPTREVMDAVELDVVAIEASRDLLGER